MESARQQDTARNQAQNQAGWLGNTLLAVAGWLACAAMCLAMTIALEEWAEAWESIFPVALAVLFGNVAVFMFVVQRFGSRGRSLLPPVACVCLCEGMGFLGLYLLGRYVIGA